ncbi:MAG: DUF952 domain-containing protein [Nocardioidaceae bacterium]
MLIFHVADPAHWEASTGTGSYTVSTLDVSLDEEGFIHCSCLEQLDDVLRLVYGRVHEDQTLLVIDTDRLSAPWQFDDVPGADQSYPHVYGPLNPDAVIVTAPIRRTGNTWVVGWEPADVTD